MLTVTTMRIFQYFWGCTWPIYCSWNHY